MACMLHHQEGVVFLQVVTKVASDIIEEENIRSPDLTRRKLHPIHSSIIFRIPLQIIIFPAHVQPDKGGEDSLLHVKTDYFLQSSLKENLLVNTLILDRDEERVVVGAEEGVQEGLLVGGVGGGRGQDGEEEEKEIVTNHGDGWEITISSSS